MTTETDADRSSTTETDKGADLRLHGCEVHRVDPLDDSDPRATYEVLLPRGDRHALIGWLEAANGGGWHARYPTSAPVSMGLFGGTTSQADAVVKLLRHYREEGSPRGLDIVKPGEPDDHLVLLSDVQELLQRATREHPYDEEHGGPAVHGMLDELEERLAEFGATKAKGAIYNDLPDEILQNTDRAMEARAAKWERASRRAMEATWGPLEDLPRATPDNSWDAGPRRNGPGLGFDGLEERPLTVRALRELLEGLPGQVVVHVGSARPRAEEASTVRLVWQQLHAEQQPPMRRLTPVGMETSRTEREQYELALVISEAPMVWHAYGCRLEAVRTEGPPTTYRVVHTLDGADEVVGTICETPGNGWQPHLPNHAEPLTSPSARPDAVRALMRHRGHYVTPA